MCDMSSRCEISKPHSVGRCWSQWGGFFPRKAKSEKKTSLKLNDISDRMNMLYNGIPRVSCQKTDPVDWGFGDILPFVSFCDIPIHHSCHLRTGEEKKQCSGSQS